MAAVAERRCFGMFTAAPGHRFGFSDIGFLRGEAGAFVRSVAEGLGFGLTTGAPIKGTWLGGLNIRTFAGDFWLTHNPSVAVARDYSMQKAVSKRRRLGSCLPGDQAGLTGTVVV